MKMFRRICLLLLALITVASAPLTVLAADASVTFVGHADRFVFLPGSDYTETDLFDNFKGLMPGDTATQAVIVKNDNLRFDYIKVYLRAEVHDEDANPLSPGVSATGETVASMTDFLSQLHMTVKQGEQVLYDAAPSELDGFAENVLLGTFNYGEFTELSVELNVPIDLGNEYAYRVGEVDWVFTVEGYNKFIPIPDTGETPALLIFLLLAVFSFAGIFILVLLKRKSRTEK